MTNDLTTIEGCLQEAIDKLEANLSAKGVTASYSSSDGYLDLLDEILNISTSGGSSQDIDDAIGIINGYKNCTYTFNTTYETGMSAIALCDEMTGTIGGKNVTFTKGSNGFSLTIPILSTVTLPYSFTLPYDNTNFKCDTYDNDNDGVATITGNAPQRDITIILMFTAPAPFIEIE